MSILKNAVSSSALENVPEEEGGVKKSLAVLLESWTLEILIGGTDRNADEGDGAWRIRPSMMMVNFMVVQCSCCCYERGSGILVVGWIVACPNLGELCGESDFLMRVTVVTNSWESSVTGSSCEPRRHEVSCIQRLVVHW